MYKISRCTYCGSFLVWEDGRNPIQPHEYHPHFRDKKNAIKYAKEQELCRATMDCGPTMGNTSLPLDRDQDELKSSMVPNPKRLCLSTETLGTSAENTGMIASVHLGSSVQIGAGRPKVFLRGLHNSLGNASRAATVAGRPLWLKGGVADRLKPPGYLQAWRYPPLL
ncbi:MAG: hypothetical protein UY48_C0003G0048 [Candidatus Gottesmanbacteria bacterium GW2011_GWB1_49_7]|uniref:Uncharacterized protein n=1 Tax=Candidatus Gottesmanbacteria bacterium GW2011_GWB1_49_7 TaxID=1618448 RepID=A0A0G1W394_9BACT|nr:MAG: hypothetical protein UY48_C0003G0048 [Candidatus Gottesmanbacteria bacterium GW2011_GWB1_49_7]